VQFAPGCVAQPSLPCQVFRVTPLIAEMIQYATRWDAQQAASDQSSQPFLTALAGVVGEAAACVEDLWFPRARTAELDRAVSYTLAHLGEVLSFSDVARAAITSERTLSRRFAEEFSMSWSEFVQRASSSKPRSGWRCRATRWSRLPTKRAFPAPACLRRPSVRSWAKRRHNIGGG
jgi:hypothetical protein